MGFRFGQKYLRQLAGAVFFGSVIKTMLVDASAAESIIIAGRTWTSWSPIAALSAAVFYVNRMLRVSEGAVYSSAAAGLIAMVLGLRDAAPIPVGGVAGFRRAAVRRWVSAGVRRSSGTSAYIIGALGTGAGLSS